MIEYKKRVAHRAKTKGNCVHFMYWMGKNTQESRYVYRRERETGIKKHQNTKYVLSMYTFGRHEVEGNERMSEKKWLKLERREKCCTRWCGLEVYWWPFGSYNRVDQNWMHLTKNNNKKTKKKEEKTETFLWNTFTDKTIHTFV